VPSAKARTRGKPDGNPELPESLLEIHGVNPVKNTRNCPAECPEEPVWTHSDHPENQSMVKPQKDV
jgi:hypothetical protein